MPNGEFSPTDHEHVHSLPTLTHTIHIQHTALQGEAYKSVVSLLATSTSFPSAPPQSHDYSVFAPRTVPTSPHSLVLYHSATDSAMGVLHEQDTSLPLLQMSSPRSSSQSNAPPPYAYTPLSPTISEPSSPTPRKSLLLPPPEGNPLLVPVTSQRTTLSDPLLQCDAKFATLIIQQIILPRARVGVLKWKDRETLEFYPQNKDDVFPHATRSLRQSFPPNVGECVFAGCSGAAPWIHGFETDI